MKDAKVVDDERSDLRRRLAEAEETLRAIRSGEIDAIVVEGEANPAVYTLKGAADPYRLLVEQMAEGALTVSSKGVILYCNAAFARMIGRPRERLVGSVVSDLIVPRLDRPQLTEFLESTARGREIELQADSGETIHAYVSSAFLTIDNELLHCLVVTNLTHQELRILHEAIVGSSPDGICSLKADGTIASWNAAAVDLFGYSSREAIGNSVCMLFPAELCREVGEILRRVLQGEVVRDDFKCVTKSGAGVDVSLGLSPIIADDKSAIVVIARDITDRKTLEGELRDAGRRKDEFIATLAHELRNPLAPLRNGLYVLSKLHKTGDATQPVHEMMERQVNHLVRLVDDLMDVSRISRGKISLKKEPSDLGAAIRQAAEMTRELVEANELELKLMLAEEPLTLDADPARIAQVFSNLLDNAAKYTHAGGRVEIFSESRDGQAIVTVADTGIGIPAEMLPRVFDLFTQMGGAFERSRGGIGIGLALVRDIVRLHGGDVEAHSDGVGLGSRFVVRLPLATAPAVQANFSSGMRKALSSHRVLVIEDNLDVADSFALLLKTLGATVQVANDGAHGLEAFADLRPDLVFVDLGMPDMNGYETARRIRERPGGKDVTLIALSGWGGADARKRTEECGCDRHLVKPVEIQELEKILESSQITNTH
ncbi:PAS domain S-box protein [Methylocystis heyeri]|uniref:histidine kinase n=1 Tax=Methylocystis heyeri TaxID=391905 RepID=A0A6B8KHU1_9HYPH|nr:PAS domain S-box protein [Methylocystis heyeri]QGM46068.1 PAS domain S-box protein [Methylocystis heyeri]